MFITKAAAIITIIIPMITGSVDHIDRQTESVKKIVAKARQLNNATTTAKLSFTQSGGAEPGSGTIEYAQGNKFRLTIPSRTIVSNGVKTWSYMKSKNQVIINQAASGGQITPNDILQSFPGDYTTSLEGEATVGGRAVWKVNASASGDRRIGDISNAVLYIDKSTYRFRKITVTSPTLGTMTLQITAAEYNLDIPASRFIFTPPSGSKVIDLS